jgi:hypothetical protein
VRWLVDNAGTVQLRARTAKLATPDPLYIMRATPTIRLIYRETVAGIEVLDIVNKATLQTFLNRTAAGAKPGRSAIPARKAKAPKRPIKDPVGTPDHK